MSQSGLPLVSVIVPTYNRAALLEQTIESVLAQTYPAIELIVVDDGSTDGTSALLERYGKRIRAIRQQNAGGTAARNTGLRAASGSYLTCLDHDDLMLPDKIARQVDLLERRPELGLAHCRWYTIDAAGRPLERIGLLPEGDVFKRLVLGCFVWSGGPLFRRRCLDDVGGFDPAIWSSDWDMWLRIAQAGHRFGCVQEPLGCYRILPDSTMADVARTEREDEGIFRKVFASPGLPAEVAGVRNEALAIWRFWLSRRYFATGGHAEGQRNLAEALRLHPALLADRAGFIDTLCAEALDVRVTDGRGFIEAVLAHLPPAAESLRAERPLLLRRVLCGLALRRYAAGDLPGGQELLAEALALAPQQRVFGEEFARALFDYAMRLPQEPQSYIRTLFRNLPPAGAYLASLEGRVLSDVQVGYAFEDYWAGRRGPAARRILGALRRRPVWLRNRGVVAVLARSLPALMRGERPAA